MSLVEATREYPPCAAGDSRSRGPTTIQIRVICARGIRGPGLAGSGRLRLAVIKESGQIEVPRHTRRDPDGAAMGALTLGFGGGTI
jgi:hypothetical protein